VVDHQVPHPLLAHHHGGRHHLDVHEGSVLPGASGRGVHAFTSFRRLADPHRLFIEIRPCGNQVVQEAADGLGGRVPEEPLRAGIP
jgi:hypothetical protein